MTIVTCGEAYVSDNCSTSTFLCLQAAPRRVVFHLQSRYGIVMVAAHSQQPYLLRMINIGSDFYLKLIRLN